MRKAQSTPTNPKGAHNLPPIRRKLVTELPRPARPMMISARIKVTPKNNTIRMNGIIKAEPPLAPAMYGNFQMAPRPTAEPVAARIMPVLELQLERASDLEDSLLKSDTKNDYL